MPYSSWTKLKMPLDLDGSVILFSNSQSAFGAVYTIASGADMTQLQGETPAKDAVTALITNSGFNVVCVLFPELRDVAGFFFRFSGNVTGSGSLTVQTSTDTTNGLDGVWTACTVTGTGMLFTNNADWWRSNAPATINNNTGIRGIRFSQNTTQSGTLRGIHIFGKKTSGQTVDDILFLDSDGSTVSTVDFDYGDVAAGGTTYDTTVYVKNSSTTKVANNVVLSFTGSNPGDMLMSIDAGANFFTTRTLTTLGIGATQAIVARLTTPSVAGGNATPRAANLRAAVTSWT